METKKAVLITRELREGSLIRQWAGENNLSLVEKSFIQTIAVTGLTIPETDWIFFSSPQSVELYFEQYDLRAKKVAALSEGTAHGVSEYDRPLNFIGDPAKTTKEIGADFFKQLHPDESVLFPLSDISKKNVSAQNTGHKVIELITYKTASIAEKINEDLAIVLFTSPSNVDGYLQKNKIAAGTRILAIGETTRDHLNTLGFSKITVSESTNEKQLVKALKTLL